MKNKKYCVYLTLWRGMFYIGKTSIDKIEKGYRGSVMSQEFKKIWAHDLKYHPDKFSIKIFKTYESEIEALEAEEKFQKALCVLDKPNIYVNRAISNKYFRAKARVETFR